MIKTTTIKIALTILTGVALLTGCGSHKDTKEIHYETSKYSTVDDLKGVILDFYGYEMMIMGYSVDKDGNIQSATSNIITQYETCSLYSKRDFTYQCARIEVGSEHQEVFVFNIDNDGMIHGVVGIQNTEADGFTEYDLDGDANFSY